MKLDLVIYSKTTAIGLFWFGNWYGEPLIMFIYEAEYYEGNKGLIWDAEILEQIKSLGEITEENEELTTKLKESANILELIPPEFFEPVATIYAKKGRKEEYYRNRKINYSDLIKCCPIEVGNRIKEALENPDFRD